MTSSTWAVVRIRSGFKPASNVKIQSVGGKRRVFRSRRPAGVNMTCTERRSSGAVKSSTTPALSAASAISRAACLVMRSARPISRARSCATTRASKASLAAPGAARSAHRSAAQAPRRPHTLRAAPPPSRTADRAPHRPRLCADSGARERPRRLSAASSCFTPGLPDGRPRRYSGSARECLGCLPARLTSRLPKLGRTLSNLTVGGEIFARGRPVVAAERARAKRQRAHHTPPSDNHARKRASAADQRSGRAHGSATAQRDARRTSSIARSLRATKRR
jgi:hypothetical protein